MYLTTLLDLEYAARYYNQKSNDILRALSQINPKNATEKQVKAVLDLCPDDLPQIKYWRQVFAGEENIAILGSRTLEDLRE